MTGEFIEHHSDLNVLCIVERAVPAIWKNFILLRNRGCAKEIRCR